MFNDHYGLCDKKVKGDAIETIPTCQAKIIGKIKISLQFI